ncbi:MAG: tRNA lysidine(34) synthetase TilS [Bacteroidales bacterium]
MGFYEQFLEFTERHALIPAGQKVLLAVSGGMDSMVMTHLFARLGMPMALAHCNFMLRPGDADRDQQLVEQTARQLGVPFFTESFDTRSYSRQQGISIQMAARQLRYQWLNKMANEKDFQLIATAHHLDDSIETLLINLSRGTGLRGLTGIPRKNEHIIRPLLFAQRQQIEQYAAENQVASRQDLSNLETKYLRNKIRHQVVPVMQAINPSLHQTMAGFFERMEATEQLFSQAVQQAREVCIAEQHGQWLIAIGRLKQLSHPGLYLYEFLNPLGFTAPVCKEIISHIDSQPGKRFFSGSHGLLKDREILIVYPISTGAPAGETLVHEQDKRVVAAGISFDISLNDKPEVMVWPDDERTALLDHQKLRFPLVLRPWRPGDRLIPLGMKGHKKVSDLLIDNKLPLTQKQKVLVLACGQDIVWVAGIKVDNRYKITKNTKTVFSVSMR